MVNKYIKSRQRVKDIGEVYTPEHIVKDMLDMVEKESYSIDSTFLEPSAGNGNFLVEILRRKLQTAATMDIEQYDRNLFIVVSSIYSIDIMQDNIIEAKQRMYSIIESEYEKVTQASLHGNKCITRTIKYLLDENIQHGNTLTGEYESNRRDKIMLTNCKEVPAYKRKGELIVIPEWNISGDIVQRKDHIFNELQGQQSILGNINKYSEIDFRRVYELEEQKETKEHLQEDLMGIL